MPKPPARIVLTGGPGGGKTTAADLYQRETGDRVVLVPEAATLLFGGGFPRVDKPAGEAAVQRAIYHVQRNHEDALAVHHPDRVLLCDRGTIDGAAYWPGHEADFFASLGTTMADELARYDAVIFFETAAAGGADILGNNPHRNEDHAAALALDARLRALWMRHPHFVLVPHHPSFFQKLSNGMHAIDRLLGQRGDAAA